MKSHLRSALTFLIGWPLSFIALFFIFKLMMPHTKELGSQLENINYFLVTLGVICFVTYYFLRSYIYELILRFLGYNLTLRESAFYWAQSELHRYIPGNIWSFLGRSVLFSKKNVEKKDIASSLIIESQLVLVGTLLVTILGIPFILKVFLSNVPYQELYLPLAIILGAIFSFLYVYSQEFSKYLKFKILKKLFLTNFTPRENTLLLLVSTFSYVLFGLGYFFIMSSLFPIHPQETWELTGFFAFSLLVGYISILTPTGLGIREGIIIVGLRNIASSALVGFASILTRAILIASEIIYLLLAYIWHRSKNSSIHSLEPFVSKNKHAILLAIAILLYSIYFTITSFLRFDHFYTGRFDLGNMAQTVWNTFHGSIFTLTDPNGTQNVSRLAFHADFILILLAPFYALWENPKMLLLIQAVVSGLGAIFAYLLAKKILKGQTLPLIIAVVFLLNPSLQRANIYDFHAVTLATTFLLGAFYFLLQKRYFWLSFFLLLAAITKEQVWLIVMFFGLYVVLFQKKILPGILLTVVGIGMFIYLIFYAIPESASAQHFALSYYSDFGDKPGTIVKNMLFSPQKTIPLFFEESRVVYYYKLLGPLGFLPLLSPFYLIFASGDGVIGLLSSNPQLRQIYYQYTTTITPFLFISLIFGVSRLMRTFPNMSRNYIAAYLLITSVYGAFLYGPLPGAKEPNLAMYTLQRKNASEITKYLDGIPLQYSVAATNNAGSHLSHRPSIYAFPKNADDADIVVLLSDSPVKEFNKEQADLIMKLKANENYLIFREEKDFLVFKKMIDTNISK